MAEGSGPGSIPIPRPSGALLRIVPLVAVLVLVDFGRCPADLEPPVSSFAVQLPQSTRDSNLTVTVAATDALSAVTAMVAVDNGEWRLVAGSGAGGTSLPPTPFLLPGLPEGPHDIYLRAVDAAGNMQPPPYPMQRVVVDTTPPLVTLTSTNLSPGLGPASGNPGFLTQDRVQVCVDVQDASPTSTNVRLVFPMAPSSGGGDVPVALDAVLSNATGCAAMNVSVDGNYTLTVTATDAAGNAGLARVGQSGDLWFVVDRQAPTSAFTHKPRGITNAPDVHFTAEGNDTDPLSQQGLQLFVQVNGGAWQGLQAPGPQSLPLPDGQHVVRLRAVDGAGNVQVLPAQTHTHPALLQCTCAVAVYVVWCNTV